jgi:Mn2+/Fe2+ NRAMP family transporter
MIADVDAASIITAAESGATFGTKLVWFLIILILPLYFIQEVAGRVGAVTNQGLGELIHKNYGKKMSVLASVPMALVDIISYITEYSGIAIAGEILGIAPYISVVIAFMIHIFIVYKKKYTQIEWYLLIVSILFVFLCGISAFLTSKKGIAFTPFYFSSSPHFIFLLAANIGAVIMPFMLFYQVSATSEKKTTANDLWAIRVETGIGAIVSEILMILIVIATTGIHTTMLQFASPDLLSKAFTEVAGKYAPSVFALGLLSSSFLALIVISLGSSWSVIDSLGLDRKNWFKIYLIESIPAVIIPMVCLNLINLVLNLMVLQILVLIAPAIMLGCLSSNKKIMGKNALKQWEKIFYWGFLLLIFSTGLISIL